MNFKELLLGTPEEQRAQRVVNRLSGRIKLAPSQREDLGRSKKITRKLFLRRTGLAGASLLVSGLGINLALPRSKPKEADVQAYYPELDSEVKNKGTFQTQNLGRNIDWYNFTDARFDQDAAAKVYSFFELISATQSRGRLITNQGHEIDYTIAAHKTWPLKIFIVPEAAREPSWVDKKDNEGAYTLLADQKQINLTVVKLVNPLRSSSSISKFFKTPEEWINHGAIVGAAQATFFSLAPSSKDQQDVQEAFCNSIAFAVYARSADFDYQKYSKFTAGFDMQLSSDRAQMIRFDEEAYGRIPKFPAIIRK